MKGAPLILFGLPDMQAGETRYAIEIPKLGSLILTHDPDGTVKGLKSWPREDWPRVPIVFWSFRVMVGLGVLMVATGLVGLWLRWRGRLYDTPLFCPLVRAHGPVRLRRAARRLVRHRDRAAALHGLRPAADGGPSRPSPRRRRGLADRLRRGLLVVFGIGVWYLLRLMRTAPTQARRGTAAGA